MLDEIEYVKRLGARIFGVANDLKRTPQVLAAELGVEYAMVRQVIVGETDLATAEALLQRIVRAYPVSLTEVLIERPDTDDGVVLMTASASRSTARTFERPDRDGALRAYFEYWDTAMSRAAPFKPECVRALRTVEDADPDNPRVAFNKGHLMHQLTFYVGRVNAYWSIDGRRYCAQMATGDSSYMAPFVPHSFTSPDPSAPGMLIAVTYAGEVQRAIASFARVAPCAADELAGEMRDPLSPVAALVRRYRKADGLSVAQLADRLSAGGVPAWRARALAQGQARPEGSEVQALAQALGVRRSDLMFEELGPGEEVVIYRAGAPVEPGTPASRRAARPYPDDGEPAYRLTELARTPHQPGLRGLEVTVLPGDRDGGEMRHHLHEYVYNYGETAVTLHWGAGRSASLDPGGSAYVEPLLPHRFIASGVAGHLAVVRVPGAMSDAVLSEFACYAAAGRERVTGESMRWF